MRILLVKTLLAAPEVITPSKEPLMSLKSDLRMEINDFKYLDCNVSLASNCLYFTNEMQKGKDDPLKKQYRKLNNNCPRVEIYKGS